MAKRRQLTEFHARKADLANLRRLAKYVGVENWETKSVDELIDGLQSQFVIDTPWTRSMY